MLDTDSLYEEIDEIWPVKRSMSEKAAEKTALCITVKTQEDFSALKNKIEIKVEDIEPRKLPSLISLLSASSPTPKPVFVVQSLPEPEPEEEQPDVVVQTFQEIYDAWPENDIEQNEKYARIAFVEASRKRSLDDLKKACSRYIEEMNDPKRASTHILGIKRFVSDDDIFDNRLQKAAYVSTSFDTGFFDEAYRIYPEFANKNESKVKEESLSFYRRFVKEEEAVDFYCAVKAYASGRRDEIRESQFQKNYEPGNDNKFTKKFVTFIRNWKQQPMVTYMCNMAEGPLIKAFDNRNIPYRYVYPDLSFRAAIGWHCQTEDKDGNPKGIVYAITKVVEDVCNYLTTGKNSGNMLVRTEVDYSIVSEVVSACKSQAKTLPKTWKRIENE